MHPTLDYLIDMLPHGCIDIFLLLPTSPSPFTFVGQFRQQQGEAITFYGYRYRCRHSLHAWMTLSSSPTSAENTNNNN